MRDQSARLSEPSALGRSERRIAAGWTVARAESASRRDREKQRFTAEPNQFRADTSAEAIAAWIADLEQENDWIDLPVTAAELIAEDRAARSS